MKGFRPVLDGGSTLCLAADSVRGPKDAQLHGRECRWGEAGGCSVAKISRALILCLALVVVLWASGCGRTAAVQPSTTPKASTRVSEREAAKRYLAAMAPVIEQDYAGYKQTSVAEARWKRELQARGPSDWTVWQDLAGLLTRFVPKEQQILDEYEAIHAPPAFRSAHAALLADNEAGLAWTQEMIHDIYTQRSGQQAVGVLSQAKKGLALNRRVVREFRKAAAKLHLKLPVKLLKVYSS